MVDIGDKKNGNGVQIWFNTGKWIENGVRAWESGKIGKHGIVR